MTGALKYKLEGFIVSLKTPSQGGQGSQSISKPADGPRTQNELESELTPSLGIDSAKKGNDQESKIDKYLTENLYYNSEHHQGKSNIIDKEEASRIQQRGTVLQKMGDSVPIFIRELSSYQLFWKEASFSNLAQVINVGSNSSRKYLTSLKRSQPKPILQ